MRMILEIGHRKVLMCTFDKVITSNYTRLFRYVQKPMPKNLHVSYLKNNKSDQIQFF